MSTLPNPLLAAAANPPALGTTIAMPGPAPSMGTPVLPHVTLAPPPPPTQTQRDMTERDRRINTGDGISQIHNPLLRGIARAADIAGSVFAPGLAAAIPGTFLHHQILVNQATRNVANDQAEEQAAAQTANEAATTAHTNAATDALQNPNDKFTPIQTDSGFAAFDPKTGKAAPVLGPDGTQVGTPDKTKPKSIEEQAYEYAVKSGKNPLDAFGAVYGAKNTKDAGLPQQYLDAISSGDTTKAALIKQVIHDTSTQPKIEIKNAGGGAGAGLPASSPGQVSPLVQAIIDGRSPAPNSRSKAGMALMAQVTAADPAYDASRYNTYQAAQKEMTSGKTGANINALNTLINHINDARQHLPDNGQFSPLNAIENTGGSLLGKNPTGKFDTDAVGIGGEFGKLVSGGVATVDEQKHLQKLLDHNASPNTIRDNLDEIENLAHGKLEGIYKQVQSSAHPGAGSNIPSSLPVSGVQAFTDGGTTYHIPADQVTAFKKDHPNAR